MSMSETVEIRVRVPAGSETLRAGSVLKKEFGPSVDVVLKAKDDVGTFTLKAPIELVVNVRKQIGAMGNLELLGE